MGTPNPKLTLPDLWAMWNPHKNDWHRLGEILVREGDEKQDWEEFRERYGYLWVRLTPTIETSPAAATKADPETTVAVEPL